MSENKYPASTYEYSAEMSAIGAMLLSERAADELIQDLDAEMFFRHAHGVIFGMMKAIRERGEAIDVVTLEMELSAENKLDVVGGPNYLMELAEFCPSPVNAPTYARTVRDKFQKRRAYDILRSALADIQKGESMEVVQTVIGSIEALQTDEGKPFSAQLHTGNPERHASGMPTGFPSLDATNNLGGMPEGHITLVMAKSGTGKTTFAQSLAVNLAQDGRSVLWVTVADLGLDDLHNRAVRMISGWGRRPGSLLENEKYENALTEIGFWDFEVFDCSKTDGRMYVEVICQWVRSRCKDRAWEAVVIDYAQELRSRSQKGKGELAEQNECAYMLRRLAARTGLPVVVCSQISDTKDKGVSPKNSTAWFDVAGWALLVRDEGVEVVKSRFQGRGASVPVRYEPTFAKYEDYGVKR